MEDVPATRGRPPLPPRRATSPLDSLTDALTAGGLPDRVVRLVLDTISDGVLVVDADGRVLLCNPALERIVGPGPVGASPTDWAGELQVYRPGVTAPCRPADLTLSRALRGERVEDVEQLVRR